MLIDIAIILITIVAIVNKKFSLKMLMIILSYLTNDSKILDVSSRKYKLVPYPPPGATEVIKNRS